MALARPRDYPGWVRSRKFVDREVARKMIEATSPAGAEIDPRQRCSGISDLLLLTAIVGLYQRTNQRPSN